MGEAKQIDVKTLQKSYEEGIEEAAKEQALNLEKKSKKEKKGKMEKKGKGKGKRWSCGPCKQRATTN